MSKDFSLIFAPFPLQCETPLTIGRAFMRRSVAQPKSPSAVSPCAQLGMKMHSICPFLCRSQQAELIAVNASDEMKKGAEQKCKKGAKEDVYTVINIKGESDWMAAAGCKRFAANPPSCFALKNKKNKFVPFRYRKGYEFALLGIQLKP